MTTALPTIPQIQKATDGFSLETTAPTMAVAKGKTPNTTPPWDAGTVCIAHADKIGKPTTTPDATPKSW